MPRGNKGKHTTCHHVAYRLSCEEFDALRTRADGRCESCGLPEEETPQGYLYIDHDRRRGNGFDHVRGMVCPKCNSALRYVDNGFREPTPAQQRYLANAWFWTHPPSLTPPKATGRKRSQGAISPTRPLRIPDDLWDELGQAVGPRGRSALIVDAIRWYLREPGAKLPKRPAAHDATAGSENDHTRP